MTKWKVQFSIGASCFEDSFEAEEVIVDGDWLAFYIPKQESDAANKKIVVAMYKATDVRVIRGD